MKKYLIFTIAASLAGSVWANAITDPIKKSIKTDQSKVTWKGYKVTGSHEGTLSLAEGYLDFNGSKLAGGEFVVDMTSLKATDLEGEYKQKLEGHLKSDDFFSVKTYPTSKLVFKRATPFKDGYSVESELTIKDQTHPVVVVVSILGDGKAVATLKVDRTKFDVKYRSGNFFQNLGDNMIYDDFDLVVNLAY